MKPILALGLLGLLAACAQPVPTDPLLARCQQQADNTPEVKAVLVTAPTRAGDPNLQFDLDTARRKAINACLAAAGHAPRGGVEPVRQAHYGFGNY